VKTYSDAARSGLSLRNRAGLKQLLKDVVDGQLEFRAVLVYDVSRWGRFQDTGEAAHYEYLCKSSGVPIHYCAEMFSNDNSVCELMLKAICTGVWHTMRFTILEQFPALEVGPILTLVPPSQT
jgi:DNA invertase Pin-like site-specific DNA recombinase